MRLVKRGWNRSAQCWSQPGRGLLGTGLDLPLILDGGRGAAPRLPALLQLQGVVAEVFMVLLEAAESAWNENTARGVTPPAPPGAGGDRPPPGDVCVPADADLYI